MLLSIAGTINQMQINASKLLGIRRNLTLIGRLAQPDHGCVVIEQDSDGFNLTVTIEKSADLKVWTGHQKNTVRLDSEAGKTFSGSGSVVDRNKLINSLKFVEPQSNLHT